MHSGKRISIKIVLTLLFLCVLGSASGAQRNLSEKATISILTSTPYEDNFLCLFGHAALRIIDPELDLDYVFDYGVLNISEFKYIIQILQGDNSSQLWATDFNSFKDKCIRNGTGLHEQVLNLTLAEKGKLWQALLTNAKEENRYYRYDMFKKSCVTFPLNLVGQSVNGKLTYSDPTHFETIRKDLAYYTRNWPWFTFFMDLTFGNPILDKKDVPLYDRIFMPKQLKEAYTHAVITTPGHIERPLVLSENELVKETRTNEAPTFFTPLLCSIILLLVLLIISCIEWRKKRWFLSVDLILFSLAGLGGLLVYYFSFFSPFYSFSYTSPSCHILWLHPFYFILAFLLQKHKSCKAVHYLLIFNSILLLLTLLLYPILPQHFNNTCYILIICLLTRSILPLNAQKRNSIAKITLANYKTTNTVNSSHTNNNKTK